MNIKVIRNYLNKTQNEFAEMINVSFATINRWENGHDSPSKIAQSKIYDICKQYDVPAFEMIIKDINEIVDNIDIDPNRIILYHGSKSEIAGSIKPISRKLCDFGQGFYMGTDPRQPLTLISDYKDCTFYIVSINLNDLSVLEIPNNIDWAMFVAFNRGKLQEVIDTSFYEKYQKMGENKDIIIGSIADDRMFFVLDNFFSSYISDEALIRSLSALKLGRQYVAITEKACDSIKIEKEIKLSYLDKLILKDEAKLNRKKGVTYAKSICRNYRKEGTFFDDILDSVKEENDGRI